MGRTVRYRPPSKAKLETRKLKAKESAGAYSILQRKQKTVNSFMTWRGRHASSAIVI